MTRGPIFWTVDKKNKVLKETVLIKFKNHPWNGAAPSFTISLKKASLKRLHLIVRDLADEKMKRIDASPWTKKYFTLLSIRYWASKDLRMGINLNMFSSIPTHIPRKELDLNIIMILTISEVKKKRRGNNIIVKQGENYSISWLQNTYCPALRVLS